MRLIETKFAVSGMILAQPIFNDKCQVLLNEGIELKQNIINRLVMMGIPYIYIKDKVTEDISYKERIPRELKYQAIQSMRTTFHSATEDSNRPNPYVFEKHTKDFLKIVRTIQMEIRNNQDLLSIMSDVYSYDNYIFNHSFNVTIYTIATGSKLGLNQKELEILGLGAMLHDIGKMNIPKSILLKEGKLTDKEFEVIKKHTEDGFDILRRVHTIPLIAAHCAYQHHERLDGTGYPRGIKNEDIHLFGKIIAVADVFDAVTSNRVYRKAMLPSDGLELLFAGSGTSFDPKVINAFRQSVVIYPLGITVELSDGRKGIVSKQNQSMSERPFVRIIEDQGGPVKPYEINLMNELSVVITNCDTKSPFERSEGESKSRKIL